MEKELMCDWLPPIWLSQGDRSRNDAFKEAVRLSAAFMRFLVSRTAVALLSMFLCIRQALAGFHFFLTPHPGCPKPWINWDGLEARWRLRNLRPHTSSGRRALSPQASSLKAGPNYYLGEWMLSWYSTAFTKGSDAIGGVSVWNNSHQDPFAKDKEHC